MARRRKKDSAVDTALASPDMQQELAMFTEWVDGSISFAGLGKKYSMAERHVGAIAKRNKWHDLRVKFKSQLYADTMDKHKDRIVGLIGMLDEDVSRLRKSVNGKKKLLLTKDERAYILKYFETLAHEVKLHDGKPTTINSGEVVTRIVLPEGVEDAWIIPPDPSVRIEREKPAEQGAIDDAQFNEILEDHRGKKS